MSLKIVTKASNSSTNRKATVLYDSERGTYLVKFYRDGKHEVDANYSTTDKEDALSTVKFEMNRELLGKQKSKHKSKYAEKHAE